MGEKKGMAVIYKILHQFSFVRCFGDGWSIRSDCERRLLLTSCCLLFLLLTLMSAAFLIVVGRLPWPAKKMFYRITRS